jgi:molybdopterin-guanine dinucleotide biosynthesis protein
LAIVVVGGHSRSVGKTSLVAGLISAMPECNWTAVKITQFGHGICSVNGKACQCATDAHSWSISAERDRSGGSDTSRFLVAGAQRSLWVRTRQGMLAEAMPALLRELAGAQNAILESNSIMRFLRPDVYLTVLDPANPDFKDSARKYLELASAVVLHETHGDGASWKDVSLTQATAKPLFYVAPPQYCTPQIVDFVRQKIGVAQKV